MNFAYRLYDCKIAETDKLYNVRKPIPSLR